MTPACESRAPDLVERGQTVMRCHNEFAGRPRPNARRAQPHRPCQTHRHHDGAKNKQLQYDARRRRRRRNHYDEYRDHYE